MLVVGHYKYVCNCTVIIILYALQLSNMNKYSKMTIKSYIYAFLHKSCTPQFLSMAKSNTILNFYYNKQKNMVFMV